MSHCGIKASKESFGRFTREHVEQLDVALGVLLSAVILGVVFGPGGAVGRGLGQPRCHLFLDLPVLLQEFVHLTRFHGTTGGRLKRMRMVGQTGR